MTAIDSSIRRRLTVLDPTVEALPADVQLAARPVALDGLRVGLLDNGKHGVSRFLDRLEAALRERYPAMTFTRERKANASRPAPAAMLDRLAASCDVVVSAVGD